MAAVTGAAELSGVAYCAPIMSGMATGRPDAGLRRDRMVRSSIEGHVLKQYV